MSREDIPLRGLAPREELSSSSSFSSSAIHPINMDSPLPPPPAMMSRQQQQMPPPLPAEAKHFKKWFPWLIPFFVLANVVMFVMTMYVNNCPKNSHSCVARSSLRQFSFQPLKENPLLGPSSRTLDKMGALVVNKIVHEHQQWRLASCMWLHGGVFHLLANMISLLIVGIGLEREFGFVRIGLVYIISGIGGSLFSALLLRSNISVGASGALFGLLGAVISDMISNWSIYTNKAASLMTLVIIIVVNLGIGMLPGVDNFAHIGGFVSGILIGFVLLIRPQSGWISQKYMAYRIGSPKRKYKFYQCTLLVLSLDILVGGFVVGFFFLFKGVDLNRYCTWCHYMSCIPTSRWTCNSQLA